MPVLCGVNQTPRTTEFTLPPRGRPGARRDAVRRVEHTGVMVTAATIAILVALFVLVNIEAWRRRITAEIRADQRRRATRERAWEAVQLLDREAA